MGYSKDHNKGEIIPYNNSDCILRTADFFNTQSVFSLNEAARDLAPAGGRKGTVERLKYHLKTSRLKLVTRGIYAVIPPGVPVESYHPDPFLVAAAVRPDGVFSYHSALELLGAAHSVWIRYTLYVEQRRRPLSLNSTDVDCTGCSSSTERSYRTFLENYSPIHEAWRR
jgi:hypothetical protein